MKDNPRQLLVPGMSHAMLAGTLVIATQSVLAGGLYVGEFGQPNMSASRAGAQALVEDASTAWQNPAGITFLDEEKSMATVLIVDSENTLIECPVM